MRLVDARNHRQGDGDQRPRLTAVLGAASRTRSGTAPTSLLGERSAAEGSTDQQGESAPHWIKLRFGARGAVSGYSSPRRELVPFCALGIAGGATDLTYISYT